MHVNVGILILGHEGFSQPEFYKIHRPATSVQRLYSLEVRQGRGPAEMWKRMSQSQCES